MTTVDNRARPKRPTQLSRIEHKLNQVLGRKTQDFVDELICDASGYDLNATYSHGEELVDVKFVPQEQVGAIPALHAKWQEAGHTGTLSSRQRNALKDAGFRVIVDEQGAYAYWRKSRIQHAWVLLTEESWKLTRCVSAKTTREKDWMNLASTVDPRIPPLPGCFSSTRTVFKESMIEAIGVLDRELPKKITHHKDFVPTLIHLWESSVNYIESLAKTESYPRAITAN